MKNGKKYDKGNGNRNGDSKIDGSENDKDKKAVVPGIELVLNGGKKEMDAATIPIQWFFSEEVIVKKPTHLLFFEQTESEARNYFSDNYGRRYVCKVAAGTKFIQLFSSGYHRMMVLAIDGDKTVAFVKSLLEKEGRDNYVYSLSWEAVENGSFLRECRSILGAVAVTVVEFFVPEALFAAKPKTAFQKAVWKWANYEEEELPRDQCEYRERVALAITFKPIVFLVKGFFIGLGRIIGSIRILVASGLLWFFGWRPESIKKNLKRMMLEGEGYSDDLREYPFDGAYKLLDKKSSKRKAWAPWEIVLLFLAIVCLYRIPNFPTYFMGIFAILASSAVVAAYFIKLMRLFQEWRDSKKSPEELEKKLERWRLEEVKWEAERKAKKEKRYQEWLAKNYSFGRKGEAVNLDNIPVPLGLGDRAVQMFQISFWSLKAKLCRPYSR